MATGVTLQVYQFIKDYIKDHTHPPTIREIADGCYLASSSVVHQLDRLEGEGKIFREPHKARGITLLDNRDD